MNSQATHGTRTREMLAVGLITAVSALVLYTYTLSPVVPTTDGGELILAAWLPGIAHPPGFPLWVLAGWIFSHLLPVGSVAWRLNWMSAFWGAAAAGVIGWVILLVLQRSSNPFPKGRVVDPPLQGPGGTGHPPVQRPGGTGHPPQTVVATTVAALTAALCLAASRTLWSWSVVTEVYSLHACLVAAIVALLFLWSRLLVLGKSADSAACAALLPASLLYGLALGNHSVTIAALAPAILYWLVRHRQGLAPRIFIWCTLAISGGLLVYAYLPLRAASQPLLNWGDPVSLSRWWWHVSGKQYQVNLLSSSWADVVQQLGMALRLMWNQFGPWNFPLAVFGLAVLWRRDRTTALFTLLVALVTAAYALAYDIADDRDAYYLNAVLMAGIWLGCGYGSLAGRLPTLLPSYAAAARGALLLLPLATLSWNWPAADHRHYTYAADYAENALREAAPGAILITADWQLYAPLLTLLNVEGKRPDLAAVDVLMFQNRPWYHDQLRRAYPGLLERAAGPNAAFLEKLKQFEAGRLPAEEREIGQRYRECWLALLSDWLPRRPVYITPDAAAHLRQFGISLDPQLLPGCVLFRVLGQPANPSGQPVAAACDVRPFLDAVERGRVLDEPARKIQRAHAVMALNRGLYLRRFQAGAGAREAFELAARIDPQYEDARRMLEHAR